MTEPYGERLSRLITLEIQRILNGLIRRQDMMAKLWSRHHARQPFLDTLFSRWRTLGMTDLAALPSGAAVPLEAFYDVLDDVRSYFAFTEDMPVTLNDVYEEFLEELVELGEAAVKSLGLELVLDVDTVIEEPEVAEE